MPRCVSKTQIASVNTHLHLLNQNYIVKFNLLNKTKEKHQIKNEDFRSLWNQQSIEVRGKIYMTGGAIANSKVYLKQTMVFNDKTNCFERLADMNY